MKYFVATLIESNHYVLNEFDNLNSAYKFYLENAGKRVVLKNVDPKVVEGGGTR